VLGGFTTFSAVVVESLQLEPKLAITYLFSSIFAGLIATTFAFSLSRRIK
jgi:fluoride ion exporter CrcB/FEX